MKIKKITLNNIRSYGNQQIEFSEGSTLLAGDIGSGKTSALLGIEFALFGLQPGQRGSSLLKNGANEGGVVIEFEVDGKYVVVERTLKRGKTVSQDYCSIIINGEKEEISVMELKSRVLELLNYPKEFSKKQNILYKFTVYTPQEEMKQIILQDSETRINTLRHVFGIDKYKKILENSMIVLSRLKEEKKIKEGFILNLEQDKSSLTLKEANLESRYYNLSSIEKELFLKKEKRLKSDEEKAQIFKKIEEKSKFNQEIEKAKIVLSNKKELVLGNLKTIEKVENQVKDLRDLNFRDEEIQNYKQAVMLKKEERRNLNERNVEITAQINSLNIKNQENENTINKIKRIEICPTCLQDVNSIYKSNVVNKLESDTAENFGKIKILSEEKRNLLKKVGMIDNEILLNEGKIHDLNILKIKIQDIKEKQAGLEEIKGANNLIKKDVELLKAHLETLRRYIFELNKFDNIFKEKEAEFEKFLKEERSAEIKVAELKKEIEVFSAQIVQLRDRISEFEKAKEQLSYLVELENWISKKFIPVISFIEKNVMINLKEEFSRLFEKWFCMLVSDSFNIRLRDDFTPIVEQQGYEIDYSYLSGGERTAIALAYRLSLNQVINSVLSKIKTKDLVILDEPTEGFSSQQLDKMRDVLQELNIKQLIIVSHEQKMENFVDNTIKIKKENGVSVIEK